MDATRIELPNGSVQTVYEDGSSIVVVARAVHSLVTFEADQTAWLAERRSADQCAIPTGTGWCFTHDVKEGFDHYLATRPSTNSLGFAVDD